MVACKKHTDQWIKINTNCSVLGNPARLGTGGILSDKTGQQLMAFATTIGEGTNNNAEIEVTIFVLTWALELGYRNIILEHDSQLFVKWIN